ncbi:MAG: hypothetical protein WCI17_10115 [bacterium]
MASFFYSSGLLLTCFLLAGIVLPAGAWASTGSAPEPATASGNGYQMPEFDRYLPIVERMPFGLPPPPPPASVPPGGVPPPAADLGKNFVLFEIVRTPAGDIIAGFGDNGAKPPRNLLLGVGEELDGYKVVAADVDLETATLEKDGVPFNLRLASSARTPVAGTPAGKTESATTGLARPGTPSSAGANPMSMAEFASRMSRMNPEAAPRRSTSFDLANQPVPNSVGVIDRLISSGIKDNSYLGRLRERREQLVRQSEDEAAKREQEAVARAQNVSGDEIDKRLRETNLNLIRKGLKPIGTIELTPAEDARLVAEGVLPAR